MAGPLGCANSYGITVMDRDGERQLSELLDVSALTWTRVVDDTSEAQIVVPYQGVECCETLNALNDWCNQIAIWRDGTTLVWQGPITYIDYGRDETVIEARDITAWLFKRLIKTLIDYTADGLSAQDLSTIAEALVTHGYGQDDPGVLAFLTVVASGVTGERKYAENSGYVGDALNELARTGIDYTAIGRRLIIAGELPIATLPTLTDDDFVGALRVIRDGRAASTAATVIGAGVVATSGAAGVCGLLETLVTEEEILDQASAQAEADSVVMAGNPTPLYVSVPDGAGLSPDAPVGINDLVPGVLVPVTSTQTCKTVAAQLRLQRLSVTFGSDGELVGVTLVPPGISNT